MKKKSLILFLMIVLSLLLVDRMVYALLHSMEQKVYTGQSVGKANLFNKVKDSVDLMILGSSRAARHVDPELFPVSGFNMGMDGTHLGYATALMAVLDKEGQTILVHIDHHEVFDDQYDAEDMLALLNEATDDSKMEKVINKYFPEEIILSKVSKSYVYNGKVLGMLKNYLGSTGAPRISNGFDPLEPSAGQRKTFQDILNKEGRYQELKMPRPLKVNTFFESLVEIAQKSAQNKRSEIIFFTSPSLNKVDDSTRARTTNFFSAKGIRYIDDLDFFNDFDIDHWKDRSHMSKYGAELYSKNLSTQLFLD